jgi:hypothetical protein
LIIEKVELQKHKTFKRQNSYDALLDDFGDVEDIYNLSR